MKLEVNPSRVMTSAREDDLIRLSRPLMKKLGVVPGSCLSLTTKVGSSLELNVAEITVVDSIEAKGEAFVSEPTFAEITSKSFFPVTLGCDPEFVFLGNDGKVNYAAYWLPHYGPIGSDGPLAELRPDPGLSEGEVTDNLRKLINSLPLLLDSKDLSGRGIYPAAFSCWQNYAIGFHIHLGMPKKLLSYGNNDARQAVRDIVALMDYFVGIPAMLLEDDSIRRLGNGPYGKPGDYRISSKTVEYRTPGGFHLRHPEYAGGIMGLALCVANHHVNQLKKQSHGWKRLDKVVGFSGLQKKYNLPEKETIRQAILEPSKSLAINQLPNILKQLQLTNEFEDHKESINTYFRLVIENKQHDPKLLLNW